MQITMPENILISSEYLIILSKFNLDDKNPITSNVSENPAANNATLIAL